MAKYACVSLKKTRALTNREFYSTISIVECIDFLGDTEMVPLLKQIAVTGK